MGSMCFLRRAETRSTWWLGARPDASRRPTPDRWDPALRNASPPTPPAVPVDLAIEIRQPCPGCDIPDICLRSTT